MYLCSRMILVVLVGVLWIYPSCMAKRYSAQLIDELTSCFNKDTIVFLEDNFYGIINASVHWPKDRNCPTNDSCLVFLQKNDTKQKKLWKSWPQVGQNGTLYIPKDLKSKQVSLYFLNQDCNKSISEFVQCVKSSCQGSSKNSCISFLQTKDNVIETLLGSPQNTGSEIRSAIEAVVTEGLSVQIVAQSCRTSIKDFVQCAKTSCTGRSSESCTTLVQTGNLKEFLGDPLKMNQGEVNDLFQKAFDTQTTGQSCGTNISDFVRCVNTSCRGSPAEGCTSFLEANDKLLNIGSALVELSLQSEDVIKGLVLKNLSAQILGQSCSTSAPGLGNCNTNPFQDSAGRVCNIKPVIPNISCVKSSYDKKACQGNEYNDKYILNMTASACINCDNPVKTPDEKLSVNTENITDGFEGGQTDAKAAVKLMAVMGDLVSTMNGTSASLSVGGAEGVLVKQANPSNMEQVSFGYQSSGSMEIIQDDHILASRQRSVSVSKEAFEKALSANITIPFAAVLRFMNMTPDENNRTTLGNEVIAVEMGAGIKNLTDKISINFRNVKEKGNATCYSWNGEGGRPNWTSEGCTTIVDQGNIACECTHLTFFAILMTPLNETISSSDLGKLTTITQVGCGLSMFFLCVVLFMHFLIRKTKANVSTKIFIHLVFALCLLNLCFLVNTYVANLNNAVGCKLMAALMHYFMLATFSWFAVQGLHLCLQLHGRGSIVIQRYELKVSVPSWALPGVVVIVLLGIGKYGDQTIHTDNPANNVAMCWINDNTVHYFVNVGYYMLVFLFTFTTAIITVSWLFCLRRTSAANKQTNQNGRSIVTILGLCCLLGITWGFAFFAYGSFRLPAYYIFTILNSFQGFFLFIYYYNTRQPGEVGTGANAKGSSSSSISTLKTNLEVYENPYHTIDK